MNKTWFSLIGLIISFCFFYTGIANANPGVLSSRHNFIPSPEFSPLSISTNLKIKENLSSTTYPGIKIRAYKSSKDLDEPDNIDDRRGSRSTEKDIAKLILILIGGAVLAAIVITIIVTGKSDELNWENKKSTSPLNPVPQKMTLPVLQW